MESMTSWGPLHVHLTAMKAQVDRVLASRQRPSFGLVWQLSITTPLAVAHTAWSRMWVVFLTFVAIAAARDPTGRATTWLAVAGRGFAAVWLGVTLLSLAIVFAVLPQRLAVGYRRNRFAC